MHLICPLFCILAITRLVHGPVRSEYWSPLVPYCWFCLFDFCGHHPRYVGCHASVSNIKFSVKTSLSDKVQTTEMSLPSPLEDRFCSSLIICISVYVLRSFYWSFQTVVSCCWRQMILPYAPKLFDNVSEASSGEKLHRIHRELERISRWTWATSTSVTWPPAFVTLAEIPPLIMPVWQFVIFIINTSFVFKGRLVALFVFVPMGSLLSPESWYVMQILMPSTGFFDWHSWPFGQRLEEF